MPKTKIPQDGAMTESDKWREWGKKLAIGAITACLGGDLIGALFEPGENEKIRTKLGFFAFWYVKVALAPAKTL